MINWQTYELGEVISNVIDNRGRNPPSYKDVGVPVIDNFMIKDKKSIDLSETRRFIDNKTFNTFIRQYIQPKDVLITLVGGIGNVSQAPKEKSVIIQNTIGLRSNGKIDTDFLFYYLKLNKGKILTLNRGVAQPSVKVSDLKLLKINLPSLPVQQKISKILSNYDDLIENNLKRIKLLKESARHTYEEWFLRFRIDGKKLKVERDSRLPLGWELVKIGSLLQRIKNTIKIKSSEILESGKYPVIDQGADFISGYTNETNINEFTDTPFIVFGDHTRILKFVDFSFVRGADGTQILISNNIRMPQTLFYHSLKALDLSNYHYARHFKFLKEEKIILPTETISTAFDSKCIIIFKQIKNLRSQNKLLKDARNILLPRLMTGIIDTKKMVIAT